MDPEEREEPPEELGAEPREGVFVEPLLPPFHTALGEVELLELPLLVRAGAGEMGARAGTAGCGTVATEAG